MSFRYVEIEIRSFCRRDMYLVLHRRSGALLWIICALCSFSPSFISTTVTLR